MSTKRMGRVEMEVAAKRDQAWRDCKANWSPENQAAFERYAREAALLWGQRTGEPLL